eukprot:CAMPEP_0185559424 /NCGR_PEP_ID=MMETSP1381-20130426/54514_1 /TAXON_ID=298111 /ORGANISM="Pavlova sp., Strain CCMP459" /LENGTH=130 /DNA_ID=CAMNT_0028173039 /DNA_START=22 /DNA_END=414 /DNA_ORIENTATION=+
MGMGDGAWGIGRAVGIVVDVDGPLPLAVGVLVDLGQGHAHSSARQTSGGLAPSPQKPESRSPRIRASAHRGSRETARTREGRLARLCFWPSPCLRPHAGRDGAPRSRASSHPALAPACGVRRGIGMMSGA